ncbi:hypothetical protein BD408DRAFT_421338 [Parasitella parasitica]|nr:hypothetical protein BD408DRAFT_421338 [Parasitella parasitica]
MHCHQSPFLLVLTVWVIFGDFCYCSIVQPEEDGLIKCSSSISLQLLHAEHNLLFSSYIQSNSKS